MIAMLDRLDWEQMRLLSNEREIRVQADAKERLEIRLCLKE